MPGAEEYQVTRLLDAVSGALVFMITTESHYR